MDNNVQYVADLKKLVKARTEQLRTAVGLVAELAEAVKPYQPELAKKAIEILENGARTTTA